MHSKENLHTYCIAMKCAHQSSSSAIYRARVQEAVLGLRINELLRKAGNESIPATNYQRDVQEQNAEYYDKLTHLFSDAHIANEEIEKQLKDIRTSTTNAIRDLKRKYQLKEKANPLSPASDAKAHTAYEDPVELAQGAAGAAFEEPGVPALAEPVRWKTADTHTHTHTHTHTMHCTQLRLTYPPRWRGY